MIQLGELTQLRSSRVFVVAVPTQEIGEPDMEVIKAIPLMVEENTYIEDEIFKTPITYHVEFHLFEPNEVNERYYIGEGYNLDEAVEDLMWFIYEELEVLTEKENELSDFMAKVKNKLSTYVRI